MINLYNIRPKGFNIGNDVIYMALQHFIRQSFASHDCNIISLAATNKYESQRKAGFTPATIYEINQFGDGVILGGGNLYENGEIAIDPISLKALEKPLLIFSVSRGKIYNQELKLVDRTDVITDGNLKLLNEKAYIALSRDSATYDYINQLGVENVNGGCPTLFINEAPQHSIPISPTLHTDCLISIRTPTLMSVPVNKQYELRDLLLETIDYLKSKGYKNIKLLCHDHRDIPFAASFKGVDFLYTDDTYTFLTYLKSTRLNLTFRLHSFIPCLSIGTPAIKISYDERSTSLLDTIGMDEWNINYLHDNVLEEIKHRVENLDSLEGIKSKLQGSLWPEIKNTIVTNCDKYANEVINNKLA